MLSILVPTQYKISILCAHLIRMLQVNTKKYLCLTLKCNYLRVHARDNNDERDLSARALSHLIPERRATGALILSVLS